MLQAIGVLKQGGVCLSANTHTSTCGLGALSGSGRDTGWSRQQGRLGGHKELPEPLRGDDHVHQAGDAHGHEPGHGHLPHHNPHNSQAQAPSTVAAGSTRHMRLERVERYS